MFRLYNKLEYILVGAIESLLFGDCFGVPSHTPFVFII